MPYTVSLKAARVNAGLTQQKVADALGKSKQTIVNWENGKSGISYRDVLTLADLYEVPVQMIRI